MRWTLTCAALLIAFCSASAEPVKCPPAASSLDVSNGNYTSQPGIVFHLENFSAKMVPIGKRMPLCLAKTTDISQGQVFVTAESLTNLFTSKSSPNSKIEDLKINFENDKVVIGGKMKKGISLPFEIKGPVTPQGDALVLKVEKIQAAGLPIKGLLNVVGAHLSSMMKSGSMPGISVHDDVIIFKPEQLAHIRGQFQNVRVSNRGMLVVFGPQPARSAAAKPAPPKKLSSKS
jgi:hypothetical protein